MNQNIENTIRVINYIEDHLTEKLDLDRIAAAAGYSKFHLHRLFVKTTGYSIHDYVQRRRLTEAARLLVFTDRSILDIALTAGYESQQAFTVIFSQLYKKSPDKFRRDEEFYPLMLRFHDRCHRLPKWSKPQFKAAVRKAKSDDIPAWMELVQLILDGFPHWHENEYRQTLAQAIASGQAWIVKDQLTAAAVMIFNPETGSIDFFGVHPFWRQQGAAQAFIEWITEAFPNQSLTISTFRSGDKADLGQRRSVKELGFADAELLIEYGYPTQRMLYQRSKEMENNERN